MDLRKLAEKFAYKYKIAKDSEEAVDLKVKQDTALKECKRDLLLAYNNYISKNSKVPVIAYFSERGEYLSVGLTKAVEDLIEKFDEYNVKQIFDRANGILAIISEYKSDVEKKTRNFIHDSVVGIGTVIDNKRNVLKSKFETALRYISSLFEKIAKRLLPYAGEGSLSAGVMTQERRDLSKEKLLMFMKTPAAGYYGLDSLEMMEKVLSYKDLKEKLTILVNAIDRGDIPRVGPELMKEVKELRELLDQKLKTNSDFFEADEKAAKKRMPFDLEGEYSKKAWFDEKLLEKYSGSIK